jgi:hypothetical protein
MNSSQQEIRATRPRIVVWIVATAIVSAFLIMKVMVTDEEPMAQANTGIFLLETPAWRSRGGILLRAEREAGEALLLKHNGQNVTYRYNPGAQRLFQVSEEVWQGARGPIGDCGSQLGSFPQELRLDGSGKLLASGQEVAIAGEKFLALLRAPSGKKVALLSANDPAQGSIIPFLGGGGASGQHYHQILSMPDAVLAGRPVSIPLKSKERFITICWSFDERYVIYADYLFYHLAIVAVDIPRHQSREN